VSLRIALLACLVIAIGSCGTRDKDDEREAGDEIVADESDLTTLSRASSLNDALRLLPVAVGDKVRVLPSAAADHLGVAGMIGVVTEVSASASGKTDHAVAEVRFEELEQYFSMSANMLELVEPPVGIDISMGDRTWVRTENDEWTEIANDR